MHLFIITCILFWVQTLSADQEFLPQIPKFDEPKQAKTSENKKQPTQPAAESFSAVQPEQLNILPQLWGAQLMLKAPFKGNWRVPNSALIHLGAGFAVSPESQVTFMKIVNFSVDSGFTDKGGVSFNQFQILQFQGLAFEQRKFMNLNMIKATSFLQFLSDLQQKVNYINWVTQSLGWVWHYPEEANPYLGKTYFLAQAGLGLSSYGVSDVKNNFTIRLPLLAEFRLRLSPFPYDAAFWLEAFRNYFYNGTILTFEESVKAQLQIAKSVKDDRTTVGAWLGVQYHNLQNWGLLSIPSLQQYYAQAGVRIFW